MPDDLETRLTEDCYTRRRRLNKVLREKFGDTCPHCARRQRELDESARQIIIDLVDFCEQPEIVATTDGAFDPDAVIQRAKRFLSGGES